MIHIIIDGDNIQPDKYMELIYPKIQYMLDSKPHYTTMVVQSDLRFKYQSMYKMSVNIQCCKTRNKNATDARILYLSGKSIERGEQVIIVSNDKIYYELEDDVLKIIGYVLIQKGNKLKKKRIIELLQQEIDKKSEKDDIYLSDFHNKYYSNITKYELLSYLDNIKTINVSNAETLFFTK